MAIIQNRANKKAKISEETLDKIDKKIEANNKEILKKLERNALNGDKRYLISYMGKIEAGVKVSEEETKCAFETKEEYNALGGDSYIDTKWELLLEQKLLKL